MSQLVSLFVLVLGAQAQPLVPAGAVLEKVASDVRFSTGPAWHPNGYVIFEAPPRGQIGRPGTDAAVATADEGPGAAAGVAFDKRGALVTADRAARKLTRKDARGTVVTVADKWNGKRLGGPDDLTVDSRDRIYFTDSRGPAVSDVEIIQDGVYRVDTDGSVTRIIDGVINPSGIALSPNERTLYVADNAPKARVLLAFDLDVSGNAQNRRVLHDFGPGRGADGMAVDSAGRIWAAAGSGSESGIYVLEPAADVRSARLVTVLKTPETPSNCTFGGRKRDTLYVTGERSVFRIVTTATGKKSPPGK